jgi:hypothetical protein
MEFHHRLKGSITENLVKALLEDAGYRVVPLGIEAVVREVVALDAPEYAELKLPMPLRTLPDFLVTDKKLTTASLLEVKYRKAWNQNSIDELEPILLEQAKHWQNFLVMVFLGKKFGDLDTPANRCCVFPIRFEDDQLKYVSRYNNTLYPWKHANWQYGHKVSQIFRALDSTAADKTIRKCCEVIKHYPEILDIEK